MLKRYRLQTIFLFIVCVFAIVLLFQQRNASIGTETDTNTEAGMNTDVNINTNANINKETDTNTNADTDADINASTNTTTDTDTAGIEALETVDTTEPLPAGNIVNPSVLEAVGIDNLFYSTEISEDLINRIQGISYQENDNISLSEHMLFTGIVLWFRW